MNRGEKLLKNTIIISIGKICTSFITFLLLPIYTGILSTEEYGIVDLVNTLIYLLVPLVTLQLEQAVFRNLIESRNNFEKQSEIISTGMIQLTFQVFSVLLLCFVLYPLIQNDYKTFLIINLVAYIYVSFFLQISILFLLASKSFCKINCIISITISHGPITITIEKRVIILKRAERKRFEKLNAWFVCCTYSFIAQAYSL